FLIAEAISPSRSVKIIRKPRHGLGAAGENATRFAEQNGLVGKRDRLHARGAGLIDRERRNFLRHSAANRNLTRGIRPTSSLPRITEDRLFDLFWSHASSLNCRFGGHDAHVGRGLRSQRATELTDWRPNSRQYVSPCHEKP